MKHTVKKLLALLIAMLLALPGTLSLPTIAFAEAPPEGEALPGAADEIVSDAVDALYEEAGELSLGGDEAEGEAAGEAPQPDDEAPADAVATWWFILDDTLIATQEAREGDAIARPEDPACPEGTAFAGWFLEDGTALFVDADGDGEVDPVIAHPDPLRPEVNVIGRYVETDEDEAAEEDVSAEEDEAAGTDASADDAQEGMGVTGEPADDAREGMGVTAPESADAESDGVTDGEEPADEPTDEPADEPADDLQKPSPDGEGGSAPALTDEVVHTDDDTTSTVESVTDDESLQKPSPDGEGGALAPEEVPDEQTSADTDAVADAESGDDATSSVSPDGEPASRGSADPISLETAHSAVSSEDGSADPRNGGSAPALTDEVVPSDAPADESADENTDAPADEPVSTPPDDLIVDEDAPIEEIAIEGDEGIVLNDSWVMRQPALAPGTDDAACIGETGYATLQAAISAAQAGDTVTLIKDIETSEFIEINQTLTLDLNGKKLTSSGAVGIYVSGGSVTILNGTIENSNQYGFALAVEGGEATVGDDAALSNTSSGAAVIIREANSTGSLTVTGGSISCPNGAGVITAASGTAVISAGTISAETAIEANSGSVTITGGKIRGALTKQDSATLKIQLAESGAAPIFSASAGDISAFCVGCVPVANTDSVTKVDYPTTIVGPAQVAYIDASGAEQDPVACMPVTCDMSDTGVTGGWYAVTENTIHNDRITVTGKVNLVLCNGATLTAKQGITVSSGNSLTIWAQSGGTGRLYAGTTTGSDTTVLSNSAGIGGVYVTGNETVRSAGAITINGGTIKASGISGAGIGGASLGNGGTTIINGGNTEASSSNGAGIGGGQTNGNGGNITITGGTVRATSNSAGAGIGGGSNSNGGTIRISGGTVIATAGRGAGIGGGRRVSKGGDWTSIEITGGNVTANSNGGGAGIGRGESASEDYIPAGAIVLDWDDANDAPALPEINANSYLGKVKLTKAFKDKDNGRRFDATESADVSALAGKTIVPAVYAVSVTQPTEGGRLSVSPESAKIGDTVTVTVTPEDAYELASLTYTPEGGTATDIATENGVYAFVMPAADVTVTGSFRMRAWPKLQSLLDAGGDDTLSGSNTIRLHAGQMADYDNVVADNALGDTMLTVPAGKAVTLDLNGRTLDRGLTSVNSYVRDGNVMTVNGTLTLIDSSEAGTGLITGGNHKYSNSSGVIVKGTFNMRAGTISGNKAGYFGSGVFVFGKDAVFNLSGGTISGNSVTRNGGGVCVDSGTFNMTGGTISGNRAGLNGGGVYVDDTFKLSGGAITGNAVESGGDYGGGVYVSLYGAFNLSGGPTITDNTVGSEDNNVYLCADKTINVTGQLTNTEKIPVTMAVPGVFTDGLAGGAAAQNAGPNPRMLPMAGGSTAFGDENNFASDIPEYPVVLTSAGEARLGVHNLTVNYKGLDWMDGKPNLDVTIGGETLKDEFLSQNKRTYSVLDGTEVTLALKPFDGVALAMWTEGNDFISTDSSISFVMDADHDVTANFMHCGIFVKVDLKGRKWEEGDAFTFTVERADDDSYDPWWSPSVSVKEDSPNHSETFGDDTFNWAALGQHTYKVTLTGDLPEGVEFDATEKTVTFERAEKEGGGTKEIKPPRVQMVTFTNVNATAPTITTQPQNATLTYGYASGGTMTVATDCPDGHVLSYQWYDAKGAISGATDPTFDIPTGLAAGGHDFYCVVTAARTDNDLSATTASNAATVTVAPQPVKLTANSENSAVYDGKAHTVTGFTCSVDGLTFDGVDASGGGTDAGAYAVTFTGVTLNATRDTTGNYVVTETADGSLTITAKTVGLTWTNTAFTYDGAAHAPTATATGLAEGDICAVTVTGAQTNAGSHTATATGLSSANYALPENATRAFTIGRKTVGLTWTNAAFTYDGKAHMPTATATGLAEGDACAVTVTGAQTGAGNYTATAAGLSNANYALPEKATRAFTIGRKTVGLTWTNTAFTYDGAAHAPTATATGLVEGDACAVTVTGAQASAGNYTATAAALDNANYALPEKATQAFTIGRKTVGLTWTNTAFTYDGRAHAPMATATGLVDGDACTVTVTGAQASAGSHTAKATGLSNANYALPDAPTQAFTVAPAAITITPDDKSSQYAQALAPLTWQVGGAYVEGDDLGVALATEATASSDVGAYPITVAKWGNPNYAATLKAGVYTITKTALTVSATGYSGVYDGKAHGIDVTVEGEGATVYYAAQPLTAANCITDGSTTPITRTDAGTTTVYYCVVGGNYETVAGSKAIEITPRPVAPNYTLLAKLTPVGGTAMKLTWTKAKGAAGYDIFFVNCGKELVRTKKIATVKASVRGFRITGLEKHTAYKACVRAWKKVKGKKVYIGAASPIVHAITGGYTAKSTNVKTVRLNKTRLTLAIGKSKTLRATLTGQKSGRNLLKHHASVRWLSSDANVAKVNSKGKVTAVGGGTCTIYALANNGVRASVKVKVE